MSSLKCNDYSMYWLEFVYFITITTASLKSVYSYLSWTYIKVLFHSKQLKPQELTLKE